MPDEAKPLYLIHDSRLDRDAMAALSALAPVQCVSWAERDSVPAEARVLLYLGDEQIRDLAGQDFERHWEVGVLPHPEARQSMAALGVKGDLESVFKHYLETEAVIADALLCNGELVFSSVVIGKVRSLRPLDINQPQTGSSMLLGALKGLGRLRLNPYTVTTAKGKEIKLAALGMVALGHSQSSLTARLFEEDLPINDGRLALFSLAPRSVIGYLLFYLRLLLPGRLKLARLPGPVGLVQTNHLHVSAPQGTEYLLDGKPVHTSELELEVLPGALRILPAPAMNLSAEQSTPVNKETVRLNHVPVDGAVLSLMGKPLPLVDHASEEEYRELFVSLRESATATSSFQVLMVLSVLLALAGMYANSAPVIIGAMVLAPLMSPVVSMSMGLARTDASLIRMSLRTLAVGIGWGLAWAVLVSWAMPLEIPTAEMKSRMSPTLLDLFVAVISGIAGAYASAKEEVAKSLAGVAIAVALVPPLSVVGIGLGWGDWAMAGGAALLLLTNLVGIALAAAATFLALGFAPFKRARAGLGVFLLMLIVISAPLSVSFSLLVEENRVLQRIPRGEVQLPDLRIHVRKVQVSLSEPHIVTLVISADRRLDREDVDILKQRITDSVGEPIILEVQSNIRR